MNKEEFLKKLRKSLNILEDKEISDILSEYEGYIEEKVKDGKTEEEAVKELGDFNEIVSDLLAAYKVKSPQNDDTGFGRFINSLSDGLDNIMNSLNNKSGKDIIKILFEIIIILFIICLLKIPFYMIKDLGRDIFSELAFPLSRIFSSIWSFIIELSYILTAITFFIKMLEKRYFSNISEEIMHKVEFEEEKNKTKKTTKRKNETKQENTIVEKNPSFISALADLGILFLKFIVLVFVFGTVCYLIGMTIAIVFMIYLMFQGIQYIGILILLFAMLMGGIFVLKLCLYFILNHKYKAIPIFTELIALIILTGLGLTFSAIDVANTEIIYSSSYDTKSVSKEIAMTDNLELYHYDKIIIDNSLDNTVKIEYNYPDLDDNLDVSINLSRCGYNGYCLNSNINHLRLGKSLLNKLITSLKDKKIYINDFRIEKIVYVSEDNYKVLTSYKNTKEEYVFTKNYYLLNISDRGDTNYVYLTLKEEFDDDIEIVKVSRILATGLTANNYYEFAFENKNGYYDNDDIEEIFKECKLVNINSLN